MVIAKGSGAAARTARIADDDPVLLAIQRAPVEDMPETEQEKRDIEEARAAGRFVSSAEVRSALAARRAR